MTKKPADPKTKTISRDDQVQRVRMIIRFLYDMQKLRIAASNRDSDLVKCTQLQPSDRVLLRLVGNNLKLYEEECKVLLTEALEGIPIWEWIKDQRGLGPVLGSVLIAELDPRRAPTASSFWRFAGLAVQPGTVTNATEDRTITIDRELELEPGETVPLTGAVSQDSVFWVSDDEREFNIEELEAEGVLKYERAHADRRTRGQKCHFSPWLKAKLLEVMGGCMLKAAGAAAKNPDIDPGPWAKIYRGERERLQNKIVTVCQCCKGTGKATKEEAGIQGVAGSKKTAKVKCWNCGGTGGPAPYGNSDKHRHRMALRKAVKAFLAALWAKWRELEGLEVRPPYAAEYLNQKPAGGALKPGGGNFESTSTHLQAKGA